MSQSAVTPVITEEAKDALLAKFISKNGGPLYVTVVCSSFTIERLPVILRSAYCRWAYADRDTSVDIHVIPVIHALGLLRKGDAYVARVNELGHLVIKNLCSQGSLTG